MRTRQLLVIPVVLLGLAGPLWAQNAKGPDQTQILTVSSTAVGLSTAMLTANGNQATACVFTVAADDIRLRYDGTAPTATVGHLYEAPTAYQMSGNSSLRALRLIRVTTDATVTITCSYGPNEPSLRAAGGGGGGGGGVSATVAISQTGTDNDVDAVLSLGTLDDGLIDLDSGAGTVDRVSYGILGAASGGPVGIEGTTANGLEVDVTRVSGTVAVSSTTLATDAKLDTIITHVDTLETIFGTDAIFGTAGTPDADVLSVQGAASMTPLQVQSNTENLATQTTLAATNTLLAGGLPAALAANGGLKVEGAIADVADDSPISGGPATIPIGCRAEVTTADVSADDDKSDVHCDLAGNLAIVGGVRHDDVDSVFPVGIGYRAIAHSTNPAAVAAGDRTVGYANRAGVPFVITGHPNPVTLESQVQDADGGQTDLALVTCGASCKVVVTYASVTCDPDTTDDTPVRMGFGAANVPAGAHTGTAGVLLSNDGVAPGVGISKGNGGGILGVGADGEDLRLTISDPAGGSCNVIVTYYTIES